LQVRLSAPALRSGLRSAIIAGAVSALCLTVRTCPARANELFTLDAHATSPGNVIVDSAGTAYIGWVRSGSNPGLPDPPMFCRIPAGGTCKAPITLPIPGAAGPTDAVNGVFPILGSGGMVYVVAPRYVDDDLVVWTSSNGGQSFDSGTIDPGAYSNKTDPSNVLLAGTNLVVGGSNPGLGFSSTPAMGGSGGNFSFSSAGSGGVGGSTLGLDGSNPVEAYWNLASPEPTAQILFYRYNGSGSLDEETNWVGPSLIANGEEPRLAGGPGGLFLASLDYGGGSGQPNLLDVRRFGGSSFGAPVTLAEKATAGLFEGGAIAESPDGSRVAVVWPASRNGNSVMDLFTSTDGGGSFSSASPVAPLESGYVDGHDELALGNNGGGWLVFLDEAGLHVADLAPIGPTQETPQTPPVYHGKTRTVSKPVGADALTLRLPASCLQLRQSFYVGVGKRKRHGLAKSLHARLKVLRVTFSFHHKKKTRKKRPFRWLIVPGPLVSGRKYTVKARVTALLHRRGHRKRVVRTLKGRVLVC
jgi:hypothetical protein